MAAPEENSTELKDTPAPAVEESKKPSSLEEGQKSVAAPQENDDQALPSQDQTTVSMEEDTPKVVPEVEDNEKVVTQVEGNREVTPEVEEKQVVAPEVEDKQEVAPEVEGNQEVATQVEDNQLVVTEEDGDKMETQEEKDHEMVSEEKNQEVVLQEGNDKMESEEQNSEVASQEEDTNQKPVTEEGSKDQTDVSQEQRDQTSVPDEQNNEGLPSHEESTLEPVPQEEDSSQKLSPQHEHDQPLVSQEEETNQMAVPQQENSEMITEEGKMEVPQQDRTLVSQEETNQMAVPQEENSEMVTEEGKMEVPKQNSEMVVTEEEDSEMAEPPQEKSEAVAPQEENSEMVVLTEEKSEAVAPQEENSEMAVTEEEKSEAVAPQEENSEMAEPPQDKSEAVVPQEENSEMAVTEDEKSEAVAPQEENSERAVIEEEKSEAVAPQEENSEMVVTEEEKREAMVPQEENREMVVTEEEKNEAVAPQEENSELVVTEEEKSEAVAPQEDNNNEMVVTEVENTEVAVPQEDNNEIVVAEEKSEDATPQQEYSEMVVTEDENSQNPAPEEVTIEAAAAPREDISQLVVPQEENTQMLASHEEGNTHIDSEMILSHEDTDPQMIMSHEDNSSQMMVTHEHHMLVSHEDNQHQMLMSHEENNNPMIEDGSHHHLDDQLMVMEEDHHHNNQLMIPHHDDETNNQLMLPHDDDSDLVTPDSRPNKRRRKKSVVWEHFTIETVGDGCRRACCKQCKQSFAYSTGSKVAGTSHLKRHIAKGTCLALLRSHGHPPMIGYNNTPGSATSDPPKRRYRSPNASSYFPFDSDRCRHEIAKMIIMHDYPLHMVEHAGFMTFVANLQPRFGMVSFNTVQGDCVATYLREKQNVMKFIEGLPGRVTLTLDMWTSCESIGYVFITGHFIDGDWKPQKRMLNVEMEPYPDSDAALSHAVACCLSDWSLEGRLFSVTFNHPVGEAAVESLQSLLCIKNTRILNGQLVLGNCISHTLTSMAKELLSACGDLVSKIRDSVKYVKTLESHEEKFLELKQQLQVPTDKNLLLDDLTQWNTTYEMLLAASELKEVFSCLDTSDPHYKEAPSLLEWMQVETICSILRHLVEAANLLSSMTNPIAITFFHEAWKIQSELARLAAIGDPFINNFIKGLQDRIEKYVKDCSLVLAVAVVMDPRFKMKLVEFSFSKIYGDDAPAYIKIVDDGVHELFNEYVALPLPLTPTYEENADPNLRNEARNQHHGTVVDNGLADFDVYIMETTSHQTKSELDMYLDDSLLPRVADFDVLGWWRQNKMKYPTLSKMARDILSIPVSTATPENVFDTVLPREMDRYRSSLRPETVEALVCAKDWLRHAAAAAAATGGGPGDGVVKMEI